MLRLSRQARIFPPTLVHQRIWFRKYSDGFAPDSIGHNNKPNDTAYESVRSTNVLGIIDSNISVKPLLEPNWGSSQFGLWVSLSTSNRLSILQLTNHGIVGQD